MSNSDKEKLGELLDDLMREYCEDNDIDFDDREKGENDDIVISIDTLKDYLE